MDGGTEELATPSGAIRDATEIECARGGGRRGESQRSTRGQRRRLPSNFRLVLGSSIFCNLGRSLRKVISLGDVAKKERFQPTRNFSALTTELKAQRPPRELARACAVSHWLFHAPWLHAPPTVHDAGHRAWKSCTGHGHNRRDRCTPRRDVIGGIGFATCNASLSELVDAEPCRPTDSSAETA